MLKKLILAMVAVVLSTTMIVAQEPSPVRPDDTTNLLVVRNTVVMTDDGTVLDLGTQDITAFANGRGIDPDFAVRQAVSEHLAQRGGLQSMSTGVDGWLGGEAQMGLRANNFIWGRAKSYLIVDTPATRKLEARALQLNINGTINYNGTSGSIITQFANIPAYSPEMDGWSGCLVSQPGKTNRYASVNTSHHMFVGSDPEARRNVSNSVSIRYGCVGDAD